LLDARLTASAAVIAIDIDRQQMDDIALRRRDA
jgi:hypothetical protein